MHQTFPFHHYFAGNTGVYVKMTTKRVPAVSLQLNLNWFVLNTREIFKRCHFKGELSNWSSRNSGERLHFRVTVKASCRMFLRFRFWKPLSVCLPLLVCVFSIVTVSDGIPQRKFEYLSLMPNVHANWYIFFLFFAKESGVWATFAI